MHYKLQELLRYTILNMNRSPIIEYFRYINDSYLYNLGWSMFLFMFVGLHVYELQSLLCYKENYNISAHHHTSPEFFLNYDNYMSEGK